MHTAPEMMKIKLPKKKEVERKSSHENIEAISPKREGARDEHKNTLGTYLRDESPDPVSWYQEHARYSLQFIQNTRIQKTGHILDVGGGASTLVDDFLAAGSQNISVLDVSGTALQVARQGYIEVVQRSVRKGGHVILATFAPDGPDHCSGLETVRYSPESLHAEFGAGFELVDSTYETHHTPLGTEQKFIYCYYRRE